MDLLVVEYRIASYSCAIKFSDKQVVGDEIFELFNFNPTSNSFSGSGDRYEVINTYSTESAEILEQFSSGSNHQVGVMV